MLGWGVLQCGENCALVRHDCWQSGYMAGKGGRGVYRNAAGLGSPAHRRRKGSWKMQRASLGKRGFESGQALFGRSPATQTGYLPLPPCDEWRWMAWATVRRAGTPPRPRRPAARLALPCRRRPAGRRMPAAAPRFGWPCRCCAPTSRRPPAAAPPHPPAHLPRSREWWPCLWEACVPVARRESCPWQGTAWFWWTCGPGRRGACLVPPARQSPASCQSCKVRRAGAGGWAGGRVGFRAGGRVDEVRHCKVGGHGLAAGCSSCGAATAARRSTWAAAAGSDCKHQAARSRQAAQHAAGRRHTASKRTTGRATARGRRRGRRGR